MDNISNFKPNQVDALIASDASLLLTAARLAKWLDVSERTVWRLSGTGRLPRPVKLGRSVRWQAEEVRRWVVSGCPPLAEWEISLGNEVR